MRTAFVLFVGAVLGAGIFSLGRVTAPAQAVAAPVPDVKSLTETTRNVDLAWKGRIYLHADGEEESSMGVAFGSDPAALIAIRNSKDGPSLTLMNLMTPKHEFFPMIKLSIPTKDGRPSIMFGTANNKCGVIYLDDLHEAMSYLRTQRDQKVAAP